MLTTILVSSHCTLRPTLRGPCCSSGSPCSPCSQGRPPRGEEGSERKGRPAAAGGGKGKGRAERRAAAPALAWGPESRRMKSSGGRMLSIGSTTSGRHTRMLKWFATGVLV
ncbi:hypothetical protein EYF80_016958 [Liparis tanakae]|uniref:Uncharacterized protein n=1 Tax=Liparis tanakae TaxID=230148 RepID=A0A4Z2I4C2_9TELE|nr:hypothetical protein EYF80_016958 [Liparis tanakae]